MSTTEYDPAEDPGVRRLEEARAAGATQEELDAIELEMVAQSDNRPTAADPDPATESEATT